MGWFGQQRKRIMDTAKREILRRVPFFERLDPEAFKTLSGLCHLRSFQPGELIIGQHDKTYDVLFLLEGHARVNVYSSTGIRVSFRDMAAGAIFGELSAADGHPRSASVESVGPCLAAVMPREVFLQSLRDQPEFMMSVIVHLTRQIRTLTGRVFEFSTLAVRNRVHAELLRIAGPARNNSEEAVLSPAPTHEEIASRISTHREAVTRELARLEERGLLKKEGRTLRIRDLAKLRRLVEQGAED